MKRFLPLFAIALIAADAPSLVIAGEAFPQADIVDARALPQVDGSVAMMLTFEGASADRIVAISEQNFEKPLPVMIDGALLCEPRMDQKLTEPVLLLACFLGRNTADVAALAKRISGKDPLPDSLDEGF